MSQEADEDIDVLDHGWFKSAHVLIGQTLTNEASLEPVQALVDSHMDVVDAWTRLHCQVTLGLLKVLVLVDGSASQLDFLSDRGRGLTLESASGVEYHLVGTLTIC